MQPMALELAKSRQCPDQRCGLGFRWVGEGPGYRVGGFALLQIMFREVKGDLSEPESPTVYVVKSYSTCWR